MWEVLNTAITRLGRQAEALRRGLTNTKRRYRTLKEKYDAQKEKRPDEEEGEIGMEMDMGNEDDEVAI